MILSQKISRPFPNFPLRLFLKNIKNILCKWKIVNSPIIPSTHAVREITILSDQHSFTLHPSLSPYRWTELQRNEYTRFAWAGGTCPRFTWAGGTFFPVVLLFQFFVLAENRFWFYILLMYLEYHTVVVLC
jgi:hypothetical protein